LTDFVTIPERAAFIKGDAQSVAAGEACVRLRSSRKISKCGISGRPNQAGFTTASQPNAGFASCYVWTRPHCLPAFKKTAAPLHLCIRPIRGSRRRLLAKIERARGMPITVRPRRPLAA